MQPFKFEAGFRRFRISLHRDPVPCVRGLFRVVESRPASLLSGESGLNLRSTDLLRKRAGTKRIDFAAVLGET
jgi:hypothetical protein